MAMRLLDLFSGIGGFSYAAETLIGGYETVAFCEMDEFCQKVLKKHWPQVPIFDDVRTLDAANSDKWQSRKVMMDLIVENPELMEIYQDHQIEERPYLPTQQEFVDYLRMQTTIKELAANTNIKRTTIEHWFRKDKKGFSYPSIEDWQQIKPLLTTIQFDQEMTTIQTKEWKTKEQMWPTPTASDVEGGVAKDVQTANGRFFRQNEKGEKWGVKLRDAVNHTEEKKLWPTPNASEARQGYQDRTKGKLGTQKSLSTEIIDSEGGRQATVGQLNSDWVTWLMGYPQGYLDISTENQTISQELPKEKKTEPKS